MANAAEIVRALRDYHVGGAETLAALGTGMAAPVGAGLAGLVDYFRQMGHARALGAGRLEAPRRAADVVGPRTTAAIEKMTYEPRSDVGRRGLENVAGAIKTVTDPLKEHIADPVGDRIPILGAAMIAGGEMIGPRGAKPKPKPKPQFDPGSHQQLIPGVEPLSLADAHLAAQFRHDDALAAMNFEDANRGINFTYDPNWRGAGPAWTAEMTRRPQDLPSDVMFTGGKRPVRSFMDRPAMVEHVTEPTEATLPQSEFSSPGTFQARYGAENTQRMMALAEQLRDAENQLLLRGEEAMMSRARELNERINRRRAQAEEPGINPEQHLQLQEEILDAMRHRPIHAEGRVIVPHPGEGLFSPIQWRDLLGNPAELEWGGQPPRPFREWLGERPGYLAIQDRIVRELRGIPEETVPRRPPPGHDRLEDVPGRDPNQMNAEAIDAFLRVGSDNPSLFQYGVMPPSHVRSLDDFARYFSRQSGEDIDVRWSYGNSDESPTIERKKEHGRGEMMRDRYGDYKLEEAEEGQIKYDDRGNPVMKEKDVELVGPPPREDMKGIQSGEYEPGFWIQKEVKKTVPEGEYYRDDSGEYVYRKSRGGEPMRDERGRYKYEEVDNPDYTGDVDVATLTGPGGAEIEVKYGDPAMVTSTGAKGKGAGQLLYQTLLAHASRQGIDIGGGSLTPVNTYRLLSNVISNIARTGENTRDLGATGAGRAERAPRFGATGPQVWRAEAEEGRYRLLGGGADPDRVRFDPERGFTIDGKPASPDDVKQNIKELSPWAGRHRENDRLAGVGPKSLMRNAVFQWLRNASPEDAAKVAKKWPKEWGPIFAGIGAAAAGLGAMSEEQEQPSY